ncbi:MAG: alkaline phosphatase family protein [Chloroflexota bacterium]
MTNNKRILLFVADGLRRDLFDTDLMPTVAKLAETGVRCSDHHAIYPTHTRVNSTSLATGCVPGRHGIMANTMIVPNATEDHIIDTSDYRHMFALEKSSGGKAHLVPNLSDLLYERGERVAIAATGSPGAAMMWSYRNLTRIVNTNSAYGIADLYDLREKLGPVPERERGAQIAAQHYAATAVNDLYLDDPLNRVIVMWLCEPDSSLHKFGLGSPESHAGMQAVDAVVATVLDEMERRGIRDQFDIFFLSDHGHSTVEAHNTLREYLRVAEAEIGATLPPLVTASDYIYTQPGILEPSADDLAPLVAWLLAQDWCGMVLGGRTDLAQLPGVIPLHAVWGGQSNDRRPLLAVSPAWTDDKNEFGIPGKVMSLTTQAALKSSHGSLSPYDMHPLLILNGPSFQNSVVSELPTGAIDVLPTLLTLLDLPVPDHCDGRVLWEAFLNPQGETETDRTEIIEPKVIPSGRSAPQLQIKYVGETSYVHGQVN